MSGARVPRLLLLASDPKRAEDLAKLADRTGRARAVATGDAGELAALLRRTSADAVFADLSEQAQALLDAFEALPAPRPHWIACGPTADGALLLRALRLGARDFLPADVLRPDLAAALEKLAPSVEAPTLADRRGAILSVMGGKGGVGATFVACQLASALRARGARVALVDLALPLGDVDVFCDLRPRYTLADLAERGEFDAACLQAIAAELPGGVRVLAAPQDPEHADRISAPLVARALGLLQAEHDFVIVDTARSWSEPVLQALELSDQILLVTLLDVPTLHHVRRQRAVLDRLQISAGRIKLLANRCSAADALGDADVRGFLGCAPAIRLPNDFPSATACANRGIPLAQLAPASPLSRAFEKLALDAHGWCGIPVPQAPPASGLPARLRALFARSKHGTR
jgi:pilus assembly protein CpaE